MKKIKGFAKLSIQIAILSSSMMAISFFTETEIWLKYFNYETTISEYINCPKEGTIHYHWNYRGYVYFFTGLTYFIMSVVKIIMSHKEEDFYN